MARYILSYDSGQIVSCCGADSVGFIQLSPARAGHPLGWRQSEITARTKDAAYTKAAAKILAGKSRLAFTMFTDISKFVSDNPKGRDADGDGPEYDTGRIMWELTNNLDAVKEEMAKLVRGHRIKGVVVRNAVHTGHGNRLKIALVTFEHD